MARVVNIEQFKLAMSRLPTGITIISTAHNNQLFGFTANSFISVALEPPLVSFCLNKQAGSINGFKQSHNFAVSILAENQADIAKHFAASQPDKFANIKYQLGVNSQCPLIIGAISWMECEKLHEYEGGDHIIFIGKVTNIKVNNNLNPLIYFARGYRDLK